MLEIERGLSYAIYTIYVIPFKYLLYIRVIVGYPNPYGPAYMSKINKSEFTTTRVNGIKPNRNKTKWKLNKYDM